MIESDISGVVAMATSTGAANGSLVALYKRWCSFRG